MIRMQIEALVHFDPCSDSPKLRLLRRVRRADVLLGRAQHSRQWRPLVVKVAHILTKISKRSARLAAKGAISPTCAAAIAQQVSDLQAMIASLLAS